MMSNKCDDWKESYHTSNKVVQQSIHIEEDDYLRSNISYISGKMFQLWHNQLSHIIKKLIMFYTNQIYYQISNHVSWTFVNIVCLISTKDRIFWVETYNFKKMLMYIYFDMWDKSPIASHFGKECYVFLCMITWDIYGFISCMISWVIGLQPLCSHKTGLV